MEVRSPYKGEKRRRRKRDSSLAKRIWNAKKVKRGEESRKTRNEWIHLVGNIEPGQLCPLSHPKLQWQNND